MTQDDGTSSNASAGTSQVPAIAGGAVVVVVIAAIVGAVLVMRARKGASPKSSAAASAFAPVVLPASSAPTIMMGQTTMMMAGPVVAAALPNELELQVSNVEKATDGLVSITTAPAVHAFQALVPLVCVAQPVASAE